MREGGLEPPRCLHHWILNPARLPVPPLSLTCLRSICSPHASAMMHDRAVSSQARTPPVGVRDSCTAEPPQGRAERPTAPVALPANLPRTGRPVEGRRSDGFFPRVLLHIAGRKGRGTMANPVVWSPTRPLPRKGRRARVAAWTGSGPGGPRPRDPAESVPPWPAPARAAQAALIM